MIHVRPALRTDLQAMVDVLNPIIRAGGTTAYQTPLSTQELANLTLDRERNVSVFVAVDPDGVVAGFQYLTRMADPEIGDIASFTRQEPPLKGAGRALMAETIAAARTAGIRAINAKIRADNTPGLGYYTAMGFEDFDREYAVPLSDGTPVDRVIKRLQLDAAG